MATYYVSNTATNGFAVGNDGNTTGQAQSPLTPWLTLSGAQTNAASGDIIIVNDGTYDLGAGGLSLTKNIDWRIYSSTAGNCVITSSNATRTIALTPGNDANVMSFGAFYVKNTGPATSPLSINDVAYDATVVVNGTWIDNGSTRHLNDTYTRGTVKIQNAVFLGTCGTTNLFQSSVTPSSAKKLSVTGCTVDLSTTANSQFNGFLIQRAAGSSTSFWVYFASNTITLTAPSTLGANAAILGVRCDRITRGTNLSGVTTPLVVENNVITVSSTGGTVNDTDAIMVSGSDATAVAHGPIIRNNTCTINAGVARGISIGVDASTAAFVDDAQIYGNTVYGIYYNGVATPHNISVGAVNRGLVYGNTVYGGAVGILVGTNNGCVVSGNVVVGAPYCSLFAKGNTAAWFIGNTIVLRSDVAGVRFGAYGALGCAIQGATNNAATTFANNHVYNYSDTTMPYVIVDASQVATFKGNNYYAVGSVPANPWSYQGTPQSSLANWMIAQESTATATYPGFIKAPYANYLDYNLRPVTGSYLRGQPVYIASGPISGPDFRGYSRQFPSYVGAYDPASGDVLVSARTQRT